MRSVEGTTRVRMWVMAVVLLWGMGLAQMCGQVPLALPDAPGAVRSTSVTGTVTDTDDAAIGAARVTLENADAKASRMALSDDAGRFSFADVEPGRYTVGISAAGFASWKVEDVEVRAGAGVALPAVQLGVEEIHATVNAITQEDLAEEQISAETKQRILGVLPNFYVSYVPNAAPLTRKQKFKLALKVSIDPVTYFTTGVTAGIEQWQGDFAGYGQGFSGYAKRYGATYGDKLSSTMFGAAILPSLLHQDPRYFYLGKGSVMHRALYAISTVVICKGDNGRWQPNYSNVLGNLAGAAISSTYYPSSDQHSAQVTVDNALLGTATGAFGTLFQEFLLKHLTHLTHGAPVAPPLP